MGGEELKADYALFIRVYRHSTICAAGCTGRVAVAVRPMRVCVRWVGVIESWRGVYGECFLCLLHVGWFYKGVVSLQRGTILQVVVFMRLSWGGPR